MITLHNLEEFSLLEAARLGGLPCPSLGVTRLDSPFTGFGEISLIGTLFQVDPLLTPVWSRDAYTPSAPKNCRGRPLRARDLEEAMSRMVSLAAARRRGPCCAGLILADTAVRFASLEEMLAARRSIVEADRADDEREYLEKLLDDFARIVADQVRFRRAASQEEKERRAMQAFSLGLRRGGSPEALQAALTRKGFAPAPPALLAKGAQTAQAFREAPGGYFEAKPCRIVRLEEFAGAVVPDKTTLAVLHILRKARLALRTYVAGDPGAQARAVGSLALDLAETRDGIVYRAACPPLRRQDKRGRNSDGGLPARARGPCCGAGSFPRSLPWLTPLWIPALVGMILVRHSMGWCVLDSVNNALQAFR